MAWLKTPFSLLFYSHFSPYAFSFVLTFFPLFPSRLDGVFILLSGDSVVFFPIVRLFLFFSFSGHFSLSTGRLVFSFVFHQNEGGSRIRSSRFFPECI